MEGSINERQDPEGRIRRKGEMKLPHRMSLFSKIYIYIYIYLCIKLIFFIVILNQI